MTSDAPSLLFHVIHGYVSLQSIVCNVILMHLITKHTPIHLRSYSIMILFMSIYEMTSAISGLLIFSRVISLGNEALVAVIYGPCRFLSNTAICYSLYGLHLNALTFYNLQMTASFGFRYFILRYPTPSIRSTLSFNIFLAVQTTICFILFNFGRSPRASVEHLLTKYVPQYDFSSDVVEAMIEPLHTSAIATTIWVCLTALPCTCINILAGTSIHRFLGRESTNLAKKTQATHKQFLKALFCQFSISQLFTVAVVFFLLGHFDIVKAPPLEYAVHFLEEICVVLSPITTLYFVKPYRTKIIELVTRRQRVKPISDVSTEV